MANQQDQDMNQGRDRKESENSGKFKSGDARTREAGKKGGESSKGRRS